VRSGVKIEEHEECEEHGSVRRSARWGYELNDHSGFCTSWGSMKSVRRGELEEDGGLVHLRTRTFHHRGGTHVILAHQPSAMWVVRVEGYTDVQRRPDEASCGGSGEGSSNGGGGEGEGRGEVRAAVRVSQREA